MLMLNLESLHQLVVQGEQMGTFSGHNTLSVCVNVHAC